MKNSKLTFPSGLALVMCTRLLSADVAVPEQVPNEVMVGVYAEKDTPKRVVEWSKSIGRIKRSIAPLHAYCIQLKAGQTVPQVIAQLQKNPDIRYAEPNGIVRTHDVTPNDPHYGLQYGPQITQANKAWEIWQPKGQVAVAVIDTGVLATHPDLTAKILRDNSGNVIGYDSVNNDTNPTDDNGHGTHCAGIIAASINNSTGIGGIAGWNGQPGFTDTFVKIMPIKVLGAGGSGSVESVADGITWAADHGAKVISMSLGSRVPASAMNAAVQYAWSLGCVVVASAGNEGTQNTNFPAAFTNVISVAATDSTDKLTYFSQYGSWVKVAAPGSDILSTWRDGGYMIESGTSMACPHVAGEAALLLSHEPLLTNSQVSSLILTQVDPYTPYVDGHILAPGAGRINIYRALQATTSHFYVDSVAGADTNPGTTAAPFRTVTKALSLIPSMPKRMIHIKAGNYGSDRPRVIGRVQLVNWGGTGQARIGKR